MAAAQAFSAPRTVTLNTAQIFSTIDPAKISDYTDYMASANLYDGLVNVDPSGALVPELAEKWEVSPDATSVTFHIRVDPKCQDGSPVQRNMHQPAWRPTDTPAPGRRHGHHRWLPHTIVGSTATAPESVSYGPDVVTQTDPLMC
jgi:ABC-type transport system substrate-binding protein